MTIVNFTPYSALAGGALLGLAAAGMWWLLGRLTGISGLIGSALGASGVDLAWRLAFVGGLVSAGVIAANVYPDTIHFQMSTGYGLTIIAGLLVGFGTAFGGGCTSGHGVCGVSRLSLRSLVATGTFMAAGMVIVYFVRHLL